MPLVPGPPLDRAPGEAAGQGGARLSRPAAEVLVRSMAMSMADRLTLAPQPLPPDRSIGAGPDLAAKTAPDWRRLLRSLDDEALAELARHALDAALETLDADPAAAVGLLPGTTAAVMAQVARGCLADQDQHAHGFMVAEVDISVWEQLIQADRRSVPIAALEPREAAERRKIVLSELGIGEGDVHRYRGDLRLSALADLGGEVVEQVGCGTC